MIQTLRQHRLIVALISRCVNYAVSRQRDRRGTRSLCGDSTGNSQEGNARLPVVCHPF
jgi:hypothetical protein